MATVVKDSTGTEWEIASSTRRAYTSGCVTRWIARREWLDGDGKQQYETIKNESGRTKRFHSEAACVAAVTGTRPAPKPKHSNEVLW